MGWAVGWDHEHRRFRGYGVPAYCDAAGCSAEIDRGMGWACDCIEKHIDEDTAGTNLFVCGEHTCSDVNESDLPPEHPDWLEHVLHDPSWAKWRDENPRDVARYSAALAP